MSENDPLKWPEMNSISFATPEDARKAADILNGMARKMELLVTAARKAYSVRRTNNAGVYDAAMDELREALEECGNEILPGH